MQLLLGRLQVLGPGLFRQRLTLRLSKKAAPLFGPIWLVLDGLPQVIVNGQPEGVTLVNALGLTQFQGPAGSPFVAALLTGRLKPGKAVTVDLVFSDPLGLPISYAPRLLLGPAPPL
jgi:hypothetical protein